MTLNGANLDKLAFSTLLFALSLSPAFAQDATAIADRLKAALTVQGLNIDWTGVEGNASSMVLEGVTIAAAGENDRLPVGNVTLENVTEANGGYVAGTVRTEAFSRQEKQVEISVSPIVIHDLSIPADGAADPASAFTLYKSSEIANVTVKMDGKTAFSIDQIRADITPPANGTAMEFTGGAEKFNADLTLVTDPKSKEIIDALGYQNISGALKMVGSWQPSDGKMTLSKYDLTIDNAGTFGVAFDFSGYTMDFIKSLQDMQKKLASQPKGADNSAQGLAMLGLMQQLNFNGASLRFDDASLTNKVLDYVGKQQGMSGRDIANQAKAIVPFGMAQLNNPELTAEVSAAVGKYLDDPKSIEIKAAPPAAVPFALIVAGAMANPLDLPKTLGVTVKANEN